MVVATPLVRSDECVCVGAVNAVDHLSTSLTLTTEKVGVNR